MPTKKTTAAKQPAKGKKQSTKNVSASTAQALVTKSNADRTAQPGIIAELMNCLSAAKKAKKMLTVEELAQHLATQFPDRAVGGMTVTIRAQLSRLPKEKEFEIKKVRDGRVVRYAAA